MLAIGPPSNSGAPLEDQPKARCAPVQPIPDTPQPPSDHDRGPNTAFANDQWSNYQARYEPEQAHITEVAVSTSGLCGNPNYVPRGIPLGQQRKK